MIKLKPGKNFKIDLLPSPGWFNITIGRKTYLINEAECSPQYNFLDYCTKLYCPTQVTLVLGTVGDIYLILSENHLTVYSTLFKKSKKGYKLKIKHYKIDNKKMVRYLLDKIKVNFIFWSQPYLPKEQVCENEKRLDNLINKGEKHYKFLMERDKKKGIIR